ncbi:MAG: hypothetical protein LBR10_14995 [Prevotellaceae bacterium]|jgi:hypothetical protein|nr:hypothetical protein [Prevotellaceae bacterium]
MKNMYKICCILLLCVVFISNCRGQHERKERRERVKKETQTEQTDTSSAVTGSISAPVAPVTINIYIENSASMDGYVNGETEFKDALEGLLVGMKYHYDAKNIHLYYINSGIFPISANIEKDVSSFISQLTPATIKETGNRKSSNLNNLFQQILGNTSSDTISVLISDCIYSIKGKNTADLLSREKNSIKDAFLSQSKQSKTDLAITVIQLYSRFSGIYYTYKDTNNQVQLNGKQRPYYMCLMGNSNTLAGFNKKIPYVKFKGYNNHLFLSANDYSNTVQYTVLRATLKKGNFKAIKSGSSKYYTEINDATVRGRNSSLQFAVALNLKSLPVTEEEISNVNNYTVSKGNFEIEGIYNNVSATIAPQDKVSDITEDMTHIIAFQSKNAAFSNLSFSLKKTNSLPEWVKDSNTEDDSTIGQDDSLMQKTFGINYMITGIAEAYDEIFKTKYPDKDSDKYFEITIPISK